jgi:non-ribosomal peptide synthetase component F
LSCTAVSISAFLLTATGVVVAVPGEIQETRAALVAEINATRADLINQVEAARKDLLRKADAQFSTIQSESVRQITEFRSRADRAPGRVQKWLVRHPRPHVYFIPTSSSWLNMVERQSQTTRLDRHSIRCFGKGQACPRCAG